MEILRRRSPWKDRASGGDDGTTRLLQAQAATPMGGAGTATRSQFDRTDRMELVFDSALVEVG